MSQVRGIAVICFAAATASLLALLFPYQDDVDKTRRIVSIALTLGVGILYWTQARHFRYWMLYLIILTGLSWGFLGLVQQDQPLGAVLLLATILWTCVYIGASFDPPVTRAFAAYAFVGVVVASVVSGVDSPGAIALMFGSSFVVTMEILTRATSQLRREATTDHLTGLLNRNGLEREIERVEAITGEGERFAVLAVDLDGFKQLNDREGHVAGDRALVELAAAWREGSRPGDILARVGGDEFVAVFTGAGLEFAEAAMERLRAISPVPWSGGLVVAEPGESIESCLERADRRLYAEKQAKLTREAGARA